MVKSKEIEAMEKMQKRRDDIAKSIQMQYKLKKDNELSEIEKHANQIQKMEQIES